MWRWKNWFSLLLALGVMLGAAGCGTAGGGVGRYFANRGYDLRDCFSFGVGVTADSSSTGPMPPSLGLYVEATDFMHLGAITHHGLTAESDLRGAGIYPESRWRLGFLSWQALHISQDYEHAASVNYFKTPGTKWEAWMSGPEMSRGGVPAKDLTYSHWSEDTQYGFFLRHRGWQYWDYTGFEVAICEPFLTRFGVMLRAGFDPSELGDFLLGWFGIDYERDDLTAEMVAEQYGEQTGGSETGSEAGNGQRASGNSEVATLRADNERLAEVLANSKEEAKGGVRFVLPETILFEPRNAVLRLQGRRLLDQLAYTLRTQYPNDKLIIEGHRDGPAGAGPAEAGKADAGRKVSRQLGAARASAVFNYLSRVSGLAGIRLAAPPAGEPAPPANGPAIVLRAGK